MEKKQNEYPIKVTQEKVVERITLKNLFNDIIKALNLEKGILGTSIGLIKAPGATIKHFLYEGRYEQFHPIRFILISTAVSFFIFLAVGGQEGMQEALAPQISQNESLDQTQQMVFQQVFQQMFYDYFNVMTWMFIPILALFSYLFYRKTTKFNYAENLVANTYVLCIGNLINIISYGFSFQFNIAITSMAATVIYAIYQIYAYASFFKHRRISTAETAVKAALVIVLSYVIYISLFSFVVGIIVGLKLGGTGGG